MHMDSLWRIIYSYGIPSKIIYITRSFYVGSQCVKDGFRIATGMQYSCALSPFIFALVVYCVMMRVMVGGDTGLDGGRLRDLDFADDVLLLESTGGARKI